MNKNERMLAEKGLLRLQSELFVHEKVANPGAVLVVLDVEELDVDLLAPLAEECRS